MIARDGVGKCAKNRKEKHSRIRKKARAYKNWVAAFDVKDFDAVLWQKYIIIYCHLIRECNFPSTFQRCTRRRRPTDQRPTTMRFSILNEHETTFISSSFRTINNNKIVIDVNESSERKENWVERGREREKNVRCAMRCCEWRNHKSNALAFPFYTTIHQRQQTKGNEGAERNRNCEMRRAQTEQKKWNEIEVKYANRAHSSRCQRKIQKM